MSKILHACFCDDYFQVQKKLSIHVITLHPSLCNKYCKVLVAVTRRITILTDRMDKYCRVPSHVTSLVTPTNAQIYSLCIICI